VYNTGPSTATRNLKGLKRRKLTQTDRHITIQHHARICPFVLDLCIAIMPEKHTSDFCVSPSRRQIQWRRPVFVLGRLLAFESKVLYCNTRTTSNYVRKESKDLLGRLCLICLVARTRTEQGPGTESNSTNILTRVAVIGTVGGKLV
jgi:hypothetical protein